MASGNLPVYTCTHTQIHVCRMNRTYTCTCIYMYIYYTREGERMMRDGMMRDEREGRGERNKANTSLYGTYNTPHVHIC